MIEIKSIRIYGSVHNSIVTLKNSESPLPKTNASSKDELDDSIYFSTGHLKLISSFLIVSHNFVWNPQKLKHPHDQTVTKAKYLRWRFTNLQTQRTSLRNSNKTEQNLTAKSGNQHDDFKNFTSVTLSKLSLTLW